MVAPAGPGRSDNKVNYVDPIQAADMDESYTAYVDEEYFDKHDYGDAIARNISTPELGKRTNYTIGGFYQVNDRIRVRYNYRYNKLENTLTKENYFAGYLTTIRGLYQFDKNSFIRVVQEYNDFNDNGYTQLLFQWQPNSATIFYFGGTFNQEDIEGTWEIESSQIYMKFQYLFNFD